MSNEAVKKDRRYINLEDSIAEAERFLKRAKAAKASIRHVDGYEYGWVTIDNVLYATAKRSSMDLTRSLARLRGGRR